MSLKLRYKGISISLEKNTKDSSNCLPKTQEYAKISRLSIYSDACPKAIGKRQQ